MYKKAADMDSASIVSLIESIKQENRAYQALLRSNEYQLGRNLSELLHSFRSFTRFKKYCHAIKGKILWKKLCRKYPIVHTEAASSLCGNYFSDSEFVVYTGIFGNYDLPQEPLFRPDNCKFILFTDQELQRGTAWEKRSLPPELDTAGFTNAEKNRLCKMLPHLLLKDYRYSVYVDGNIRPMSDLTELVNMCTAKGMALHMHKARQCVYDEIEACRILKKAPEKELDAFKRFLESTGFPKHYGMNECSVIVRDHENREVRVLMEEWWRMFREGTIKRDQLTFPYLLWKHHIRPSEIGNLGGNVQDNPTIRVTLHNV